jgi:lipopolysaccharide assembly outer membrane protein LptD (OstA)
MRSVPRLIAATTVLQAVGCRKPPPRPPAQQKPSAAELPAAVNTQGIRINWRAQQKNGQLWSVLDLNAANGKIDAQSQSGTMSKTSGTLYRENHPRATFEAPTVKASNDQKTVVATGGVKMRSLEPKGILLTADRATWIIEKNKVIAEGHVYLEQRDPKSNAILAWGRAEHLTINTDLQRFSIP